MTALKMYDKRPKKTFRNLLIYGMIFFLVILAMTFIDFKGLKSGSSKIVVSILKSLISPNKTALFNLSKHGVPYLMLETIAIAFLGTFIGMLLSIPFAFLTARNLVPFWLSGILVFIINIIRTFPPFVYGLMLIRVAGPGPFTGVLTLAITSIGMMSKQFIEAIEDLDHGILEALDATGCNTGQKIRYGVLPQLFTHFLSISIYRFEINVKNASILGLVGAGGIGAPLMFAITGFRWKDAGALLWGLIILVLLVEQLSSKLRKKLA